MQWKWYVFGREFIDGKEYAPMIVEFDEKFPVSLWTRIISRIVLGSVWEKVDAVH